MTDPILQCVPEHAIQDIDMAGMGIAGSGQVSTDYDVLNDPTLGITDFFAIRDAIPNHVDGKEVAALAVVFSSYVERLASSAIGEPSSADALPNVRVNPQSKLRESAPHM